ncbi:hypothetical protein Tco_1089138, partial [Tanacetum coccineum]
RRAYAKTVEAQVTSAYLDADIDESDDERSPSCITTVSKKIAVSLRRYYRVQVLRDLLSLQMPPAPPPKRGDGKANSDTLGA